MPNLSRYRFFRVHKYITYRLFDFEQIVAKTDFADKEQVIAVKEKLAQLETLMKMHAHHEDSSILALLKQKGDPCHESIYADHEYHDAYFSELNKQLEDVLTLSDPQEKIAKGYQFYLAYRLFIVEMLQHLHEEETTIMRALQKHYTDDEFIALERSLYQMMSSEQIIGMLKELFPHMDVNDKAFMLSGIEEAAPEKYMEIRESFATSCA